jgi:hypothetical protein
MPVVSAVIFDFDRHLSTTATLDADALAWSADCSKQFPSAAHLAAHYLSTPVNLLNVDSVQSTNFDYWASSLPHPLVQ